MTTHRITGHGGVSLTVHDIGPADAPPVVLIHGWSQASPCWLRQHALAGAHRLIIPDLRGHGQSDKPAGEEAYMTSRPWAEDVAAILAALSLDRPVLVGWSMGGWVVNDYIRHYGDGALAGMVLVGSSIATGKALPPEALAARQADPAIAAAGMFGDDLAANLAATTAFVRACFHQQPDPDDLAMMVGYNMLCPPHARICRRRSDDFRADYAQTTKPVLVIRGMHERLSLPPMHAQILDVLPRATAHEYDTSGHSPFWEEPDRFNSDLAAFIQEARQ